MLQNVKTFYANLSTRFREQQKLKNLFKFAPPDGSIDTFSNLQFAVVEALTDISTWPDRKTSSRALQLLSTIRQIEFALLS